MKMVEVKFRIQTPLNPVQWSTTSSFSVPLWSFTTALGRPHHAAAMAFLKPSGLSISVAAGGKSLSAFFQVLRSSHCCSITPSAVITRLPLKGRPYSVKSRPCRLIPAVAMSAMPAGSDGIKLIGKAHHIFIV